MEKAGVEAVSRAHRIHGSHLGRCCGKALWALLRESPLGSQFDHNDRDPARQLRDRGLQIFGTGYSSSLAHVGQKDIHVSKGFLQTALPAVIRIVIGIERNRQAGRLQLLKQFDNPRLQPSLQVERRKMKVSRGGEIFKI